MTLIDTADAYGPYTNEELVGKALSGGQRERAVLATKVGLVMGVPGPSYGPGTASPGAGRNGRPEHVRTSIDGSLQRLATDHVDLYQLHRVDPQVPIEETWGAMAETVIAGKARHIGLSEVTVDEIKRAQSVYPVTSVQSELSLWTRDVLPEVLPYCEAAGHRVAALLAARTGVSHRTVLVIRRPAGGRLPARPAPLSAGGAAHQPRHRRPCARDRRSCGCDAGAGGARLGSRAGQHVVPIPGTKTPKYLVDNAGAADLQLSAQTWPSSTPCPSRRAPDTDRATPSSGRAL